MRFEGLVELSLSRTHNSNQRCDGTAADFAVILGRLQRGTSTDEAGAAASTYRAPTLIQISRLRAMQGICCAASPRSLGLTGRVIIAF